MLVKAGRRAAAELDKVAELHIAEGYHFSQAIVGLGAGIARVKGGISVGVSFPPTRHDEELPVCTVHCRMYGVRTVHTAERYLIDIATIMIMTMKNKSKYVVAELANSLSPS